MSTEVTADLDAIVHGVDGDDVVFTIGNQEVTYDELHSIALGAALGFILGERGVVFKTLRSEPWYALAAFAALYALGRALYD